MSGFQLLPFSSSSVVVEILFQVAYIVIWIPFILWGQRIQMMTSSGNVSRGLTKLKILRDKSKQILVTYVAPKTAADSSTNARLDEFLEYFTIPPVSMDPVGVVKRFDNVITTQDKRIKKEVEQLMPNVDKVGRSVAENMIGVAASLNQIFKVVRHYYFQGKRGNNIYLMINLQNIMPMLLKQADALVSAMSTLEMGQPLGDGIGPMAVGLMMKDKEKKVVAEDTVAAESEYKGRRVILLKAEGPEGNVGHVDDAVIKLASETYTDISAIIMIDAALKLEGEKTGDVAEGVGAAIGGYGIEKFKIEQLSFDKKIPVYAVIVKVSIIEAIGAMKKEVSDSVKTVHEAIYRLIEERVPENGSVLVLGVGNSLGVGQ